MDKATHSTIQSFLDQTNAPNPADWALHSLTYSIQSVRHTSHANCVLHIHIPDVITKLFFTLSHSPHSSPWFTDWLSQGWVRIFVCVCVHVHVKGQDSMWVKECAWMQSFVVSKKFKAASFSSVRFKELQKNTGKIKKEYEAHPHCYDIYRWCKGKCGVCFQNRLSLKWCFKIWVSFSKSAHQESAVHFCRMEKVHRICKFHLGLPWLQKNFPLDSYDFKLACARVLNTWALLHFILHQIKFFSVQYDFLSNLMFLFFCWGFEMLLAFLITRVCKAKVCGWWQKPSMNFRATCRST